MPTIAGQSWEIQAGQSLQPAHASLPLRQSRLAWDCVCIRGQGRGKWGANITLINDFTWEGRKSRGGTCPNQQKLCPDWLRDLIFSLNSILQTSQDLAAGLCIKLPKHPSMGASMIRPLIPLLLPLRFFPSSPLFFHALLGSRHVFQSLFPSIPGSADNATLPENQGKMDCQN